MRRIMYSRNMPTSLANEFDVSILQRGTVSGVGIDI